MTETTVQEAIAPSSDTASRPREIGERRVVLYNVSWTTYKSLLKDIGDARACRLAFNCGDLEIMSPDANYRAARMCLGYMVTTFLEAQNRGCMALGGLTCEREDLQKAIEPDGCFFIRNYKKLAGCTEYELPKYPPPDLMIEVNYSTHSLN